jgi:uncharacterized protein (DUF2147 family)
MTLRFLMISATCLMASVAAHADPIEGNWKRPSGVVVAFAKCGAKFCATAKTGPNAGKSVGSLAASGAGYAGTLSDPSAGKSYTGKATLSGASLKVSGCVLGGLICKSENWARQ